MTFYTTEQKFNHLRTWVNSGKTIEDYCSTAGISRNSIKYWSKKILGEDYKFSLKDIPQKRLLLHKIDQLENTACMKQGREHSASSMVMVNKSQKRKANKSVAGNIRESAPITVEYMGAKISIDEGSIESVFRALKAVSGCNL